jgi:hypothetical protein
LFFKGGHASEISHEFDKVRQQIRSQLNNEGNESAMNITDLVNRLNTLELENTELKSKLRLLESRLANLEKPEKVREQFIF